jgi:hypothetical protein
MPEYVSALLIGLAILLAPLALMSFGLVTAVNAMSGPRLRLHEASKTRHRASFAAAAEHHDWAKEHGFEWVGAYLLKATQEIFIAAWRQPDAPRWFCIYTHSGADYYDFVTRFDGDRGLTTSGSKDAHTLPFPEGKWVQSLHEADHELLWDMHEEAERFLAERHGTRLAVVEDDFPTVVIAAVHDQMKYVKSHPLWQVRGVWWYLTRGSKSGRTVAEQER